MWKNEREWRIWCKKPMYYRYDFGQVREVLFGVNCPLELQGAVMKILNGLGADFTFNQMEMKYGPLRLEK